MTHLFWLIEAQMSRVRPFFPRPHGRPRVDDRRVLSGIIFVNRKGLRWRDAPTAYGSHKTRYTRWRRMGVFARMLTALAQAAEHNEILMLDATHLKVHRTAASLRARMGLKAGRRMIGRTKGGLTSKLHGRCHVNVAVAAATGGS